MAIAVPGWDREQGRFRGSTGEPRGAAEGRLIQIAQPLPLQRRYLQIFFSTPMLLLRIR